MYKQIITGGGINEVVTNVEMTQEEIQEIRNETLTNLGKWLKSGIIDKEEYDNEMLKMGVM